MFALLMRLRHNTLPYSLIIIINSRSCSLSIALTAMDQKPQKSLKRLYYPPSHRLNVNVMLSNMTFLMIFAVLREICLVIMPRLLYVEFVDSAFYHPWDCKCVSSFRAATLINGDGGYRPYIALLWRHCCRCCWYDVGGGVERQQR